MADTYVVRTKPNFAYREPDPSAESSRPLATKRSIWAWGAVGGVVLVATLVFAQTASFEDELVLVNDTNAAVSVVVSGEERGTVQPGGRITLDVPYFDPPRRYQGFHPDGSLVFDAMLSWELLVQYDFTLRIAGESGLQAASVRPVTRATLNAP